MSITVITSKPKTLLKALYAAVDDGQVATWDYDTDGDFTHSRPQWANRAWFEPHVIVGCLKLGLIGGTQGSKRIQMTRGLYGVYHGRFIEMLLTHFHDNIKLITPSLGRDPRYDNFVEADEF